MSVTRSSLRCFGIPYDNMKEKMMKISVNMTMILSSWNFHTLHTASGTLYTSFQSMLSKLNDRHNESTFDWALLVKNEKNWISDISNY